MNRRQVLIGTTATALAVSLGIGAPQALRAQNDYASVDYALDPEIWREILSTHWLEAITFARLRILEPATGNERQHQFLPELLRLINRSFSNDNIEVVLGNLPNTSDQVRAGMIERLEKNREHLNGWFKRLNVLRHRQTLLLESQSVFVVLAVIGLHDGNPSAGDERTWTWPYCFD